MPEPYKICPICNTPNHRNATVCSTCGTTLTDVDTVPARPASNRPRFEYDFRYGETDLLERDLSHRGRRYLVGILLTLTIMVVGVLIIAFGPRLIGPMFATQSGEPASNNNAPEPTVLRSTVTLGPPTLTRSPTTAPTLTPSITPTPAPCTQTVAQGEDLITIIARCGHRSLDVLPLVLELNDLADASVIQAGQTIIVPWPTPTIDPNATQSETPIPEGSGKAALLVSDDTLPTSTFEVVDPFAPPPTETLQPGVMWHKVQKGENIVSIAYTYGANVEIMSQLNPEVTFSQCDFGLETGGGTCIVQIYEGQLLRVPAPTPTPTIPPTPSGSETPTPTATPTFNAPSALSPADKAFFQSDQLVTLRWIATGILAEGQVYRIRVEDVTAGTAFTVDTAELFFILPNEWQGQDGLRHEYNWTVSVIDTDNPNQPYFTTQPLRFAWQGRKSS